MIKVVYCIRKKPGMPEDEFFRHWKDVHGPIGARIPGVRKLVQTRRIVIPGDKYQPDFDGMAELWFDDVAALLRARQSAEWKISSQDEANFVDPDGFAYMVTEEQVIISDGRASG